MYGTCMSHADVHAFSDECVGWTDRPTKTATLNIAATSVNDVTKIVRAFDNLKITDMHVTPRACGYVTITLAQEV